MVWNYQNADCSLRKKVIVSFIIIFGTISSPITNDARRSTLFSVNCDKKVAHTRLPSVGFRSWFRFLAVSLQATWVINPEVGCHYFPRQACSYLPTLKRAATNFAAWWTDTQWVWTVCLRLLPDSAAAAIWTWTLLRWVQHANHWATEPPWVSSIEYLLKST